jgi:hypothetical protein
VSAKKGSVAFSPENEAKVAKWKTKAETEEAKDTAVFNPADLLKRAATIHEVKHPKLGLVRFGELVMDDAELINQCKTKKDRNAMAIYLVLKKAYPELPEYTPETIGKFSKAFPMMESSELVKLINQQPGFLLIKSDSGSDAAEQPTS